MTIRDHDNDKVDRRESEALELARRLLSSRAGVREWELYFEEEEELSIEARDGAVESLTSARARGLAVRVLCRDRLGFSFTNDISAAAMEEVVDRAVRAAGYMGPDSFPGFVAAPANGLPSLAVYDPGLAAVARDDKVRQALLIEAAARAADPRVRRVRGAEYQEVTTRIAVINSAGADLESLSTLVTAAVEVVAEQGDEAQAAYEFETVHYYDMLDFERVGVMAAEKAVRLLGGKPRAPGRIPAVVAPLAAAALWSVLAPAACGDSVLNNRSWLAERRGQRIASPAVAIVDDPLWETGPGAAPFDDEGTVSRTTTVVRSGILENFLYDARYGHRAGTGSSGNGLRGSYASPPGVGETNWVMLPGRTSEKDLIGQVEDGIYLVEFMGLHTADPASGEFSLGAQGFRIEKGSLGDPVTLITVAGSMEEVLEAVEAVADRVMFNGDSGSPAVLIGALDVSG